MGFSEDFQSLIDYMEELRQMDQSQRDSSIYYFLAIWDLFYAAFMSFIEDMPDELYAPSQLTVNVSVEDEVIDTGDGTTGPFSGNFTHYPLAAGTIHVQALSDGDVLLNAWDDGIGGWLGDVDSVDPGNVDWETGDFEITFSEAVKNAEDIVADYEYQNISSSEVNLAWSAGSPLADSQKVYRNKNDAGWNLLDTIAADAETYQDTDVSGTDVCEYKILSYKAAGHTWDAVFEWRGAGHLAAAFPEDLTSSITGARIGPFPCAGVVKAAGFYLENTGADGTDDLELEMDILVGGSSIFDTLPKMTDSAIDGSTTFSAGTGITVGVISEDDSIPANQPAEIQLTLTRTTPEDEMAGVIVSMLVEMGEAVSSEYSNAIEVTVPAA